MLKSAAIAFVANVVLGSLALAQSPHAGAQDRPIKALSDRQIADLKAGRGMGLALPAELNGYPGPSHLLELAEQIGLSDDQKKAVSGLFDAMKAETIPLGERIIAEESALDALFSGHTATAETLGALTAEIGATQAQLRAAHLRYHLAALALLQPSQVERYAVLRGYGAAGGDPHAHHHP